VTLRIPASDLTDQFLKGHIDRGLAPSQRPVTDRQIEWIDQLVETSRVERRFNRALFLNPDSRDPERAGLASAIFGSVMILIIASALALPVGVGAAIYLDSFAPKTGWGGRMISLVEVNINNLAAVPSIVFGLLGLAVFINFFGLSRSIPLVGGLVLALRMFPTIVIASRAALQAIPDSLTDSALSLGASRMQAVFNHKVPLAAPGILTGSIIGMAQALGETAPLLMIGMVAFVTAVPASPMDPATALPVQIFLWSGSAEVAWAERTSAAIIALLVVLMLINGLAIMLRERLQRKRRR
jgi:phosphate transport system permease protein